jgi:hypothetical protein
MRGGRTQGEFLPGAKRPVARGERERGGARGRGRKPGGRHAGDRPVWFARNGRRMGAGTAPPVCARYTGRAHAGRPGGRSRGAARTRRARSAKTTLGGYALPPANTRGCERRAGAGEERDAERGTSGASRPERAVSPERAGGGRRHGCRRCSERSAAGSEVRASRRAERRQSGGADAERGTSGASGPEREESGGRERGAGSAERGTSGARRHRRSDRPERPRMDARAPLERTRDNLAGGDNRGAAAGYRGFWRAQRARRAKRKQGQHEWTDRPQETPKTRDQEQEPRFAALLGGWARSRATRGDGAT